MLEEEKDTFQDNKGDVSRVTVGCLRLCICLCHFLTVGGKHTFQDNKGDISRVTVGWPALVLARVMDGHSENLKFLGNMF